MEDRPFTSHSLMGCALGILRSTTAIRFEFCLLEAKRDELTTCGRNFISSRFPKNLFSSCVSSCLSAKTDYKGYFFVSKAFMINN